jgi:hypothetical protein
MAEVAQSRIKGHPPGGGVEGAGGTPEYVRIVAISWRKREDFMVLAVVVNKWVEGGASFYEGKGDLFAFI